jgi:ribosomal protein S18 acetylase RimI-like enzyme
LIDRHAAHRNLERLAFRAWPSVETIEYDGWVLRASGGYTKRANSVNPHFGSTLPLNEKLAHCRAFYAERGLPTIFRLTPFSVPEGLDRHLEGAGYATLDRTLVMTATLDRAPSETQSPVRGCSGDEWLSAFDTRRVLPSEERVHHRRIVESAEGNRMFALVEQNGAPVACGLGVVIDDAIGLFDLYTADPHRRLGHARAVVTDILRRAFERGARTAFLQVHSENEAARALYADLGFTVAYPYWYRIGPESRGD